MSKYNLNNPRPMPTQERLRTLLSYDPTTGLMNWVNHPNRTDLNGKKCGAKRKGGYLCASVDGHKYTVHRLAYKWMTGEEPNIIDHINGVTDDNRWHNIRSVSVHQNNLNTALLSNNKSGENGVFFHEKQNRYHANIRVDNRSIHLGSFETLEEAKACRKGADKLIGVSERHGKAA